MDRSLKTQAMLENIFGVPVYFQPPPSIMLSYPCVLYELSDIYIRKANDKTYNKIDRYTLTIIDLDPDSELVDIATDTLPMVSFDRSYTADGLNHWVLSFYN